MFERFSEPSRRVVVRATEESRRRSHHYHRDRARLALGPRPDGPMSVGAALLLRAAGADVVRLRDAGGGSE